MNIIFLNSFCKKTGSIDVCVSRAFLWFALLAIVFVGSAGGFGYYYGLQQHADANHPAAGKLAEMVEQERLELAQEKARVQAHLDALAIRLGSLQAHVLRLEALGDRLVDVAKLDKKEFDFASEPALGGLDSSDTATSQHINELVADVDQFGQLLDDRIQKLDILETLISNGQLYEEITPSGRPVVKGWLSSRFGMRNDPKSGKKSFHRGLDYAGVKGSDVIAVAAGMVVRSEFEKGYGNVVEIKHTDGYTTLYAHNQENLVQQGDMVKKGQKIALLGSTGRSTGPHVHFEVHRNGKYVNPSRFVNR